MLAEFTAPGKQILLGKSRKNTNKKKLQAMLQRCSGLNYRLFKLLLVAVVFIQCSTDVSCSSCY